MGKDIGYLISDLRFWINRRKSASSSRRQSLWRSRIGFYTEICKRLLHYVCNDDFNL